RVRCPVNLPFARSVAEVRALLQALRKHGRLASRDTTRIDEGPNVLKLERERTSVQADEREFAPFRALANPASGPSEAPRNLLEVKQAPRFVLRESTQDGT